MDSIRINITYEDQQLAEMELTPVTNTEWQARVAVLLPEGLRMIQVPIRSLTLPGSNVLRLIRILLSELPLEMFLGPVVPERFKDDSPEWLKKFLER